MRTSAKRKRSAKQVALAASTAFLCGAALGEEDVPDAAFLEYLGTFEASDEEWVMFLEDEQDELAAQDTPGDAAAAKKGSREQDDDS